MIRLLVSDLDGTLLKIGNELSLGVSEENREALHQFHKQGGIIAIASSRGVDYKPEIEKQIGLPVCFVGYNGGAVSDIENVFSQSWMNFGEFKKIGEELVAKGIDGMIITSDEEGNAWLYGKQGSYPWQNEDRCPENRVHIRGQYFDGTVSLSGKCRKISLFVDPLQKKEAADFLREKFGSDYEIAVSDTDMVDVNQKGIDKGYGIALLAKHLGLSLDEVAVVGDNENDICMFQTVKHSFCIDHAEEHIQKEAFQAVRSVAQAVEYCMSLSE